MVAREAERLRISFESAREAGFRKYIMFLHYPPTNIVEEESIFTRMAEEYGVEHVVYSHCTESPVTATVSTEFTMDPVSPGFWRTTSILSLKRSWIDLPLER